MPYDNRDSNNFIEQSSSNDDNLLGSSDLDNLSIRDGLLLSTGERSGEGDLSDQEQEDQEYNTDYSDLLGNIDSTCTYNSEQIESVIVQLDALNNNVNTLNENIKIGIGLMFVLVVFFGIKAISYLLNKVLGLGSV